MSAQLPPPAPTSPLSDLRTWTHAVYALQALFFVTAITPLIGVVLNYVKREDTPGTLYESHFRWQIRTFWYSLLWAAVGGLTLLLIVGYFVWVAATLWYVYRIVKGWVWLTENRPMYGRPSHGNALNP